MAYDGPGFVQRHEAQAKEGTLYKAIDTDLDALYGKARENVNPGLMWLWGYAGYNSTLDHPEYRIKDGRKTIVARPYKLGLSSIKFLVELAEQKGLGLLIQSPSNYSLDTLLVVLTEIEHERDTHTHTHTQTRI